MATVNKVPSKGLHRMWFREDAQRDLSCSREEWEKKWNNMTTEYCSECMEKHDLKAGKCPRIPGRCGLCGKDDFIVGRLFSGSDLLKEIFCDKYAEGKLCAFDSEGCVCGHIPCVLGGVENSIDINEQEL